MEKKGKSILGVVSDILLIIILIIAIMITVMTFTSKNSDTGLGNLFGYIPFSVQTDSMNPTIREGDLIISKAITVDEARNGEVLKVGDVITYSAIISNEDGTAQRDYNTHRIVDIKRGKDGKVEYYYTKGDGVSTEDSFPIVPDEVIAKQVGASADIGPDKSAENIKKGFGISGLGKALGFLQTQLGFMVCIIIPLALFFIWQVYKLISMFMSAKSEDSTDDIKRKAIEEYLAQQEAEKKKAENDSNSDKS